MSTATATRTFTSAQVCGLAGVSYRQLDYWTRMGYLHPDRVDQSRDPTSGIPRVWTEAEAVKAVALADMLRAGIAWFKAAELIKAGRTATLVPTELRDAIIDDLPPDSRPTLVVRGRP